MATVAGSLDRLVKKDKITDAEQRRRAGADQGDRRTTTKLDDCDLVIEAATENQELKLKILKDLYAMLRAAALIASNTSSISITQLAAAT